MKWQMPGHCSYRKQFWLMLFAFLLLYTWIGEMNLHHTSKFSFSGCRHHLSLMVLAATGPELDAVCGATCWEVCPAFEETVLSALFGGDHLLSLCCGVEKWKRNIWSYCLCLCWVKAPHIPDPLVLQPGEAVWTHPNSFPACAFGCLSKINKAIFIFREDMWAPGLSSCGVHGRATPALLRGHGLCEQFRFTGEGSMGRRTEDWR